MERNLIRTIKAARMVSTPILAVITADQQACCATICDSVNDSPKITWDAVRGLKPINEAGNVALQQFGEDLKTISPNPGEAVAMAEELPEKTILFWFNAQRFVDDDVVAQGFLNLRDSYKQNRRTLILLAPSLRLPADLAASVVVLDDPLPDDDELNSVLNSVCSSAELDVPPYEVASKATDAARGLCAYEAEQVYAMSLTKDGLDLDDCWERKIAAINQTQGVTMTRGGKETFQSLGGLEQGKKLIEKRFEGPNPASAIVFIDEIEKSMAAIGTDTTGVSQDFHGTFLKWMEDNELDGMILVGPPGSGKTAFARAVGNTYEIPTVSWDLGAMKGSLVGQSEKAIREAQKKALSIGGNKILVIATCNKLDVLPPELRRRFASGIWFFDLPTKEEKPGIWKVHASKYLTDITSDVFEVELNYVDDTDWTGAEIRNCCKIAWQLDCSLLEASEFVIPVAKSNPDGIKKLRDAATGRWLSASYPGPYKQEFQTKKTRRIGNPSLN